MEELQEVKRCPNPECPEKSRVYLNGKTHCDACDSALVKSRVGFTQSSVDLIKSMTAAREEVRTLVLHRQKG